jgi:hypothetical protein
MKCTPQKTITGASQAAALRLSSSESPTKSAGGFYLTAFSLTTFF